ncbi:MAG: CRTAC1 family protein [Polyangia bacterium]
MNKVLLASLLAALPLAACHRAGQGPKKITSGSCHAVDYVASSCSGPPPARLADVSLAAGFFVDASIDAGMADTRGWRVQLGDVDGDKFPDLIYIEHKNAPADQHLMLNQPRASGRTFVDATVQSGLRADRMGGQMQMMTMATFADVDNDGDLDVFSGSYSEMPTGPKLTDLANELYLNDGTGHFTLKSDSGVNLPWPLTTVAATFLDYDHDGNLDLYVGNFMIAYPDLTSYQDNLYRGDGTGTFVLVNDAAGITTNKDIGDPSGLFPKPTYGATSCDWNDDSFADILTSTYALGWNDLWRNNGDGTFTNDSQRTTFWQDDVPNPSEPAYRQGGNTFASVCGDYDNDGDLDVFNAETTHSDFPRSTADRSRILVNTGAAGAYVFERPDLAATGIDRAIDGSGPDGEYGNEGDHGASWLDLDNDGLLDLVIESAAYPNSHAWLYHQKPDHTFENVTELAGVAAEMVNSNGLTVDDIDRDGDLDIVMGSVNTGSQLAPGGVEMVHLYENKVGSQQHFLHVTLRGTTASRQGIGARVRVTAGCLTQTREINGGKGTFGASDPAYAHFGLGTASRVDEIEIRWATTPPEVQKLYNVAVDQFLEVTQGSDTMSCAPPVR